jgi:hypothetical protein
MKAAIDHPRIAEEYMSGSKRPPPPSHLYTKLSALYPVDRILGGNFLRWIVMRAVTGVIESADCHIQRLEERSEAVHLRKD